MRLVRRLAHSFPFDGNTTAARDRGAFDYNRFINAASVERGAHAGTDESVYVDDSVELHD